MRLPANELLDPRVQIIDYGTSFVFPSETSPSLHTPPLYSPPESFFDEPITSAADIWTLGVSLYEILGERALFESFSVERTDIFADVISTLGIPPESWWKYWACRGEFFRDDGTWLAELERIYTPGFRPLHQRMWDMGRGETPEKCEWDVEGGEVRALEELLRAMLAYEPAKRPTAEEVRQSEYMVKWALPAWERHRWRMGAA